MGDCCPQIEGKGKGLCDTRALVESRCILLDKYACLYTYPRVHCLLEVEGMGTSEDQPRFDLCAAEECRL
ncbi:hypothetical protein E2C01_050896 [Portunus trituberculatus]|uniref:Uncharacterized protein n=1 Tax=Portunus trituberculatus TaxID=210409 RepID=A0A5B7GIR5_PORTR|nr:hypothetical protein [Portunus trituberculatus]